MTDGREGYLSKRWLFGAYSAELNPESPSGADDFMGFEGLGTDSYGYSRGAASGDYASHNAYWWQHDYFVHSGVINDDNTARGRDVAPRRVVHGRQRRIRRALGFALRRPSHVRGAGAPADRLFAGRGNAVRHHRRHVEPEYVQLQETLLRLSDSLRF